MISTDLTIAAALWSKPMQSTTWRVLCSVLPPLCCRPCAVTVSTVVSLLPPARTCAHTYTHVSCAAVVSPRASPSPHAPWGVSVSVRALCSDLAHTPGPRCTILCSHVGPFIYELLHVQGPWCVPPTAFSPVLEILTSCSIDLCTNGEKATSPW